MLAFLTNEMKTILNTIKDGLYLADERGVTLWLNDTSEQQLGYKREEIIGKSADQLEEAGVFTPSITKLVIEKKQSVSRVQASNGGQFLAVGRRIEMPQGDAYILVQVKDISETVRSSLRLEKAEELINQYWKQIQSLKISDRKNPNQLIGSSHKHQQTIDAIHQVAMFDATVLLQGETGVGKSKYAHEIHHRSLRKNEPFIQVNCGALPANLIESELFGYMRGASSGANTSGKIGLIEKAGGGTIFLDEVGELPIELQPKLLQFLQEKQFFPIGSNEPYFSDARVIAATNQQLSELVKARKFREDLYYRLHVIPIEISPLRERSEDIGQLIQHYLTIYNQRYKKDVSLSTDCLSYLQSYDWPGNIRELENLVERLVITANSTQIYRKDLPAPFSSITPVKIPNIPELNHPFSLRDHLAKIEKEYLHSAIHEHKTTRQAAQSLGISQSAFVRRTQKYNLH
ncbi:LOW QUALITY PROTEIN: formate hydrogenlyase transcriptional activator [Geomicrobium sp. JCM 19037]|nr:LOW QUALITY PROTEIN: formate hydrogenlyase transcriptional activator [Geomicrobium sp. JCM 19037]